ncbi:MAG TPA: HAMP domain-containing histidine kinase [Clostridiaceae bacterium]|jgi:signal transduction histidine kinase|nr:HAMP domain-containing histidine kinase [Clostridiaceae bacterium]
MKNLKLRIYSKLLLLEVAVIVLMRFLIPVLSNYPPYSEAIDFQLKIEVLTHDQQYILLGIFALLLQTFFIKIFFSDIFKYIKKDPKDVTIKETEQVRLQCYKIPKKLFFVQTVLLGIVLCMLFSMVQISIILCIKFLLIYFSFFTASWVISMVLIRSDLNAIIESTYTINKNVTSFGKKTKFYKNLLLNLIPFFIFIMITISLLGYSKVTEQNGENGYYYYKQAMNDIDFDNETLETISTKLDNIPLRNSSDYYFIIGSNEKKFSSNSGNATNFFIEYANEFLDQTDGRVYEYYGVEEQGYAKRITLQDSSSVLIGFKYTTTNVEIMTYFVGISIAAIIVYIIILLIWTKNISKNISEISNRLTEISKKDNVINESPLPLLSNDELGDLTIAFNKIQHLTQEYITQIKDTQESLMESERLSSLGQLIGGIAHNLKTPIMSIAGAAEGLNDLIKEYDSSIDDPTVNSQDHHEIASDMSTWIEKIKNYTEYMSDIITAVKGQAVVMSNEDDINFTISELVKRVTILMKHELKNAIINLNTDIKVDENLTLNGDVNNLVQVINNMISNAIQAYNGKENESIEFTITKDSKNIIFSIEDHAGGLPDKVTDKLFKEMITTKGKNGTGLGLYMSYSTIKAHFNGNITFDTKKGKGTKFNIYIPM